MDFNGDVNMSATLTYVRTYLTRIVLIVSCLGIIIGYYFASPSATSLSSELYLWDMGIMSFTLFVGLLTIFARYGKSIMKRDENWIFHLYCLAMIVIWIPFGLTTGINSDIYQTVYFSTKITLHIAILGLLLFFCVSAMYRTFRIRSLRTAVFAVLTLAMVFLNAPYLTTPFPSLTKVAFWFLDNPQMAGARAMVMCSGIGGVILGLRVLLGREKSATRATGG